MSKFIPVCRPFIDKADGQYIKNHSIKKNKISNSDLILKFEKKISTFCERKYGVSVTSGTTALEIALKSLNLPPKSKIIIPNFTIVSVLNAVLKNNLNPIFIDVSKEDYNILEEDIINYSNLKNIKAAIIVSTYNSSCEIDKIIKLLKKYNIKIIEDAAESFGGSYKGRKFGSFGDVSILSFYSNKLITTGEGGMILTNNIKISNFCQNYKNLFFNNKKRNFIHNDIGVNARFPSLLAAFGLSQFRKINFFINHRRKLYNFYFNNLNSKYLNFQNIKKDIKSAYWVFPVTLKKINFKLNSSKIIFELSKYNIQSRHFFYPLSLQPFLSAKINKSALNNSIEIYNSGFYLPLGNGISLNEVKKVTSTLNKILQKY